MEDGHVSERKKSLDNAYLVVLMLIFINWCCHVTAPNLSVVVSTLLTLVLLLKTEESQKAPSIFCMRGKRLWFATLLLSMVCYALPYMNSMFLFLFTISVAAVFYPSERVLQLQYTILRPSTTRRICLR